MLSVKGPIESTVCSDTFFFGVFKLVDFVGFKVESEAPVSTRNDVDLPLTPTIKGVKWKITALAACLFLRLIFL